jgi:hypothetical protein
MKMDNKLDQEKIQQNSLPTSFEQDSQNCCNSVNSVNYNINNIAETINSLSINQINEVKNLFDSEDDVKKFYEIENAIENTLINMKNQLLLGIGIGLSNIKEHILLDKYKKEFKKKGILLRTNRKVKITIISKNGKITYSRYVLRPSTKEDYDKLVANNEKTNIIPLDDYIGINKFNYKITPSAMLQIAYWATYLLSYHAAVDILKSLYNIDISYETVRSVTNDIGKIVFDEDIKKAENTFELYNKCKLKHYKNNHILYIETDGAMINIHNNEDKIKLLDLDFLEKDETKKSKTGWRENKLGMVFSSDNMVIKSKKDTKSDKDNFNEDQIIDDDDDDMSYKLLKREYVSYIGSVDEFQKLLFNCAIKNGYGQYGTTVLLSDGATWIRNMQQTYFCDAIHILDFYHLSEHIYEFAKNYFNENKEKYISWAKNAKKAFREGYYKKILPEIKKMQSKVKNSNFNFYNYIINNKDHINYLEYKKQKLYIGSGHIESGNKSVMQERLKRPGMIWTKDIAQNLLALRTKLKSNLWQTEVVQNILVHCYNSD